ncbi:MAG: phosphoribosylformylglycinamidine cyclo-ligase, partial [Oscillospiraceae bacterium]|nr:phosphoribosylformylglycinamidine cyclo-ligase [Oscillospiraceae bacterium]
ERIADIVKGVADGCVQAGAALIGGETAEMPGFYPVEEYDLAGFTVGAVDREKILDRSRVREGDVLVALPSSGVHSNGFSLVRKVFDVEHRDLKAPVAALKGQSLGDALLEPTRIYVKPVLALLEKVRVKGISHITGGGFYENIPRMIPDGLCAKIREADVRVLPIFDLIAETGKISRRDMFNTFNMGVGMCLTVAAEEAETALSCLRENGEDAYILGELTWGDEKICLC